MLLDGYNPLSGHRRPYQSRSEKRERRFLNPRLTPLSNTGENRDVRNCRPSRARSIR